MKLILGIDPGADTGVAIFRGGQLSELRTIAPRGIEKLLIELAPSRVVFEDSRLQSHNWNARQKLNLGVALASARSVGQVDAWCNLITVLCDELGIPAHGISPAGKGKKIDAEYFGRITGWEGKSNQHNRDAAMVAWPYRRTAA